MDTLSGKIAVVTGGASGIGRAVAEVFAETDIAGLTLADIDGGAAEEVAESMRVRFGVDAIGVATDVSVADQVDGMIRQTMERFQRVDILVNNAGIAPVTRWPEVTEANWRHVLDVNLNGAFLCMLTVLPIMERQRSGRIVNISSAGAFVGSVCAHPAYGVSKAGMIAMTKSAAKEYATSGILINAIAPGSIDTPLARRFGSAQVEAFRQASPMQRQGNAREIADAVWYLVSERSTYVTGATLHVNGGSLLV
ncbi:MAG: SDR family oxidoreductase [candidate division Zixibacteria bacterium]|nr:SDR family oxidoreductase [candidate division Zixibacteria bacterium]